jgi:hypothetical protein
MRFSRYISKEGSQLVRRPPTNDTGGDTGGGGYGGTGGGWDTGQLGSSRYSADVCVLSNQLPWAIGLAQSTVVTVRQNLFWAFAYNTIGIGIAACGWQQSARRDQFATTRPR